MGRPIVYCGDCGTSLREQDFERGRAQEIDRQPYCADCRPVAKAAEPAAPSRLSTSHVPRPGTARRRSASRASNAPLLAGGGALAAAVALIVAMASAGPARNEPAAVPPTAVLPPRPAPVAPLPPASPAPPAPVAPPPPPALAPVDPAVAVDRWLQDVREIRARDPGFARAQEIRSLLRRAAELAGSRRAEVEALLSEYEKAAAAPEPAPSPPPPTAAAAPAKGPRISATFTLLDAETEQPVPGYDPMTPDCTVDVERLGLRRIDVRINLTGKVGSLRTTLNNGKSHVENGPPWSFTTNSVASGFTGWVPKPGRQALTVTPFSEKNAQGEAGTPLVFSFTIAAGSAGK